MSKVEQVDRRYVSLLVGAPSFAAFCSGAASCLLGAGSCAKLSVLRRTMCSKIQPRTRRHQESTARCASLHFAPATLDTADFCDCPLECDCGLSVRGQKIAVMFAHAVGFVIDAGEQDVTLFGARSRGLKRLNYTPDRPAHVSIAVPSGLGRDGW